MNRKNAWLLLGIGFLVRACLFPWIGSSYATDLFLPFIRWSVEHFGENPWLHGAQNQFPYGLPLLLTVALPFQIQHLFSNWGPLWLQLSLLKLPLLAFDVLTLALLWRWLKGERHRALYWYWLNPIVIYVCYVHIQLDIVTSSLTLLSIMLASRARLKTSALFLGLAVGCKFHAIVCLPIICAYIWNRQYPKDALKTISTYGSIFLITALVSVAPVIAAGNIGYNTVLSPEAMRIFAGKISVGSGTTLYVGIAIFLLVLGRLCISTRISEQGMFYGCGALLLLLVILTDPMPGWFLWGAPFIAAFFAMHSYAPRLVFASNQVFYLSNFILFPSAGAWLMSPHIAALTFTLMQISSLAIFLYMWMLSVKDEMPLRFRLRPVSIGIAGDSGSGKDRLTHALINLLGEAQTRKIEGDDYHKWERKDEAWQRYTHLSPRANHLGKMELNTLQLMSGRAIFQAHYDHSTGKFTEPRRAEARRALIVQGLHTLYLRGLRSRFDLKVFMSPDDGVRLAWKIKRDVLERGHSFEAVRASFEKRRNDSLTYIAPQRRFADWVIEAFCTSTDPVECALRGEIPPVGVRHILWNDAPIEKLVEELGHVAKELKINLLYDEVDLERLVLELQGQISAAEVAEVAGRLESHPRRVTRSYRDPVWSSGHDGLNQLIAFTLLQKIQS